LKWNKEIFKIKLIFCRSDGQEKCRLLKVIQCTTKPQLRTNSSYWSSYSGYFPKRGFCFMWLSVWFHVRCATPQAFIINHYS
jgi:hypothetical protein